MKYPNPLRPYKAQLKLTLIAIALVLIQTLCHAQWVEVVKKDRERLSTTVTSFTGRFMVTPLGQIKYSEMDSVYFDKQRVELEKLYASLSSAKVNIFIKKIAEVQTVTKPIIKESDFKQQVLSTSDLEYRIDQFRVKGKQARHYN